MPNRCYDVGRGSGGSLGYVRGLDASGFCNLQQGVATAAELRWTDIERRDGSSAAAGRGLADFDITVAEQQTLIVAEAITVGLDVDAGTDGKESESGEEEHQQGRKYFEFHKHKIL